MGMNLLIAFNRTLGEEMTSATIQLLNLNSGKTRWVNEYQGPNERPVKNMDF